MRYLLDVNALVALGVQQHVFHERVARWVASRLSSPDDRLLTCSITELGFVRVVSQTPQFSFTIEQAKTLLKMAKEMDDGRFAFVADDQEVSELPAWVKTSRQMTDGHLAQLAKSKNAALATLDRGISGALVIPE